MTEEVSSKSWLHRRFVAPILGLLKTGLTVDQVARALALGCTTGMSPLVGTTTITGSVLSLLLKLNPVACLTANYGVYPAQILMIVPFAELGSRLTGWHNLPLSPTQIVELIRSDGFDAFETLSATMANATLAWLLSTPLIFVTANVVSRRLLHRWKPVRYDQP